MAKRLNQVFLGCNYSNFKVKRHFEALKKQWEEDRPLRVVLIDKVKGKGSKDLWNEIRSSIQDSALAIFDVTAFKPNVVLELGYCLALKPEEEIVISFDARRKKKVEPKWLLSDIGHLNQVRYKTLSQLDEKLEENLAKVKIVERFAAFMKQTKRDTTKPEKYNEVGCKVLRAMRNHGPQTKEDIRETAQGSSIRIEKLIEMLVKCQLVRDEGGTPQKWSLVEVE